MQCKCDILLVLIEIFRINPEFRILSLTFHSLKMLNYEDNNSFFDKFSDYQNTIKYLNLKLFIFVVVLQVLKLEFLKVRILEILNFHLCCHICIISEVI